MPLISLVLIVVAFLLFLLLINRVFDALITAVIAQTKTNVDDKVVPVVRKVIIAILFVTGLYFFSTYLQLDSSVHDLINKLYYSVLALLIAVGLSRIVDILSRAALNIHFRGAPENLATALPFINNISRAVIYIGAGLFILNLFEVDITPALASAGVLGVALAFAARDFVANLFGGISVFFDKPYLVGDYVIIADKYRGEVMQIGMRSTKIRTRDDILLTVPNSVMTTDTVINETGFEPRLRLRIPVQVGYNEDLENVEHVLVELAKTYEEIMDDPDPRVRYRDFGESGINLELLVVIKTPSEKGRITHEVIKGIHRAFKDKDISIPYPHRVVRMYNN